MFEVQTVKYPIDSYHDDLVILGSLCYNRIYNEGDIMSRQYEVQCVLSNGCRTSEPMIAKDLDEVKAKVLERMPLVRTNLASSYGGAELLNVEVYELVKVTEFDMKPEEVENGNVSTS